jgi:LPXTG-motif cell wall-anchored protein
VTTPVYPAIGGGLFAVISGAGLFWLQRRRRSTRFSTPALGV